MKKISQLDESIKRIYQAIEKEATKHLEENLDGQNELVDLLRDFAETHELSFHQCSECNALNKEMINGDCYECTEGAREQADIMAAQEGAYKQAKGF